MKPSNTDLYYILLSYLYTSLTQLLSHQRPPVMHLPRWITLCVSSQPLQRIENEVELLGEQLSVGGGFSYAHHHHHHHHQPPSTLPPSTPLQFLSHHDPLSQELFTVVSSSIT